MVYPVSSNQSQSTQSVAIELRKLMPNNKQITTRSVQFFLIMTDQSKGSRLKEAERKPSTDVSHRSARQPLTSSARQLMGSASCNIDHGFRNLTEILPIAHDISSHSKTR